MKSKFKIIFLLGILLTVSCCKDNDNKGIPEDKILEIKDLSYNGCKPVTKSSDTAEYIELHTVDSNYLHIKHVNALFSCDLNFSVFSKLENGNLIYNEVDSNLWRTDCICLYDVNGIIGPLEYMQYTLNFNLSSPDSSEFNFEFGQSTNKIFTINRKKK